MEAGVEEIRAGAATVKEVRVMLEEVMVGEVSGAEATVEAMEEVLMVAGVMVEARRRAKREGGVLVGKARVGEVMAAAERVEEVTVEEVRGAGVKLEAMEKVTQEVVMVTRVKAEAALKVVVLEDEEREAEVMAVVETVETEKGAVELAVQKVGNAEATAVAREVVTREEKATEVHAGRGREGVAREVGLMVMEAEVEEVGAEAEKVEEVSRAAEELAVVATVEVRKEAVALAREIVEKARGAEQTAVATVEMMR